MLKQGLIEQLKTANLFFHNSTSCLSEEDSGYAPKEGLFTVAQQVAHVAQTFDWFIEGAFRPEGFELDFEKLTKEIMAYTSLKSAREWFNKALNNAISVLESKSEEELQQSLPAGPIMGGWPRLVIINAICDHLAHHRGALTIYSRMLGKEPKMPYGQA